MGTLRQVHEGVGGTITRNKVLQYPLSSERQRWGLKEDRPGYGGRQVDHRHPGRADGGVPKGGLGMGFGRVGGGVSIRKGLCQLNSAAAIAELGGRERNDGA